MARSDTPETIPTASPTWAPVDRVRESAAERVGLAVGAVVPSRSALLGFSSPAPLEPDPGPDASDGEDGDPLDDSFPVPPDAEELVVEELGLDGGVGISKEVDQVLLAISYRNRSGDTGPAEP